MAPRCVSIVALLLVLLPLAQASDLLVKPRHGEAALRQAVRPFGKVTGKFGNTPLYTVHLSASWDGKRAKPLLEKNSEVEAVFDERVQDVNSCSLSSVREYVRFLKACEDGKNPSEASRCDYWESFLYRLQDIVDYNGLYKPEYLQRAIAQRDRMTRMTPLVDVPNSRWKFLGPTAMAGPTDPTYFGPGPLAGRINVVGFDNPAFNLFAGAAEGGLWVNRNQTWQALGDQWPHMSVSSVVKAGLNTIVVGTGDFQGSGPYSYGFMRSTDGGVTWHNLNAADIGQNAISSMVGDPKDPNTIYAATGRGGNPGHGRVYVSHNAGLTWQPTSVPEGDWSSITVDAGADLGPPNHAVQYTFYVAGSHGRLYKYVSGVGDWTQVANPTSGTDATNAVVACSSGPPGRGDPKVICLLVANATNARVLVSKDGGTTWSFIDGGGVFSVYDKSQASYDFALQCVHFDRTFEGGNIGEMIYVGLITLHLTDDFGVTWHDLGETYTGAAKTHNDQHYIGAFSSDPDGTMALVCNDGGLYQTRWDFTAKKVTFTNFNATLGVAEFYKIGIHPTNPKWLIGGAQDNGGATSQGHVDANGNLTPWQMVGSGDGSYCGFDPINPSVQFLSLLGSRLLYTTDNWATSSDLMDGQNFGDEKRDQFMPVIQGKGRDLITATDHLYIYHGGWSGHASPQALAYAGSWVRTISKAPSDPNRLYTGAWAGEVWTSADYGVHWAQANLGQQALPPTQSVVAISVSPSTPTDVLVGLANVGSSHLYRCTNVNAPVATRQWKPVSGLNIKLPDSPVNAIARDPDSPDTIWYVATDVGVYVTYNSGAGWKNLTSPYGLPNVIVRDLIVGPDHALYAGTFGRGMWRMSLLDKIHLSVSSLAPDRPAIVGGDAFTLNVALNAGATDGGITVPVTKNSALVAVPSDAYFALGISSVGLKCTSQPVNNATTVQMSAALNGSQKVATLTLSPGLQAVSCDTSVVGGNAIKGTVTLVGAAAMATHVAIKIQNLGTTATVAAGATSGNFATFTAPVTVTTTVNLTATLAGVVKSQSVRIDPPSLFSLSLSPTSIKGGQSSKGTVTLNGPAAAPITIALSSNHPNAVPPATVQIAKGARLATFFVTTQPQFATPTTVTITAQYNGVIRHANMIVSP
jgi:hypothetical protein